MINPAEVRSVTNDESSELKWQKISSQEGQFRGSNELHALAQKVIALLDEEISAVAVLEYINFTEAYRMRNSIRNAVEKLSEKKIQTIINKNIDDDKYPDGAKLYIRYRE